MLETQRVTVRVAYAGHVYDAGAIDVPAQAATCSVGCADIGEVRLTPERELKPAVCSLTVKVRDRAGDPVEGAFVIAADDTVDDDIAMSCALTAARVLSVHWNHGRERRGSLTAVALDTLFVVSLSMTQDGDTTLLAEEARRSATVAAVQCW
jgi:hypothetical protein